MIDLVGKAGVIQVGRDGACRLGIEDIGRLLVVGGREVIGEADCPIDTPEVRAWLLGPAPSARPVSAARKLRIGDGAVALTGRASAGKSTLAAALVRRGHS